MTPYSIVSLTVTISTKNSPFYEACSCAASQFPPFMARASILSPVYLIHNFNIIIPFLPLYLQLFCSYEVFQSNFCVYFSSNVRGTCVGYFIILGFIVLINIW
jgi:hypothetical protein